MINLLKKLPKQLGRDRLFREASDILENSVGIKLSETESVDQRFDQEFEKLWQGNSEESVWNRTNYIADASIAINKINFLLLTIQDQ